MLGHSANRRGEEASSVKVTGQCPPQRIRKGRPVHAAAEHLGNIRVGSLQAAVLSLWWARRCLVPVTRWLAHLCGLLPNGPGMEASLSLFLEKARVYTVGLVLFGIVFVSLRIE